MQIKDLSKVLSKAIEDMLKDNDREIPINEHYHFSFDFQINQDKSVIINQPLFIKQ